MQTKLIVLQGDSPLIRKVMADTAKVASTQANVLITDGGDPLPSEDFPKMARWAVDGSLDRLLPELAPQFVVVHVTCQIPQVPCRGWVA